MASFDLVVKSPISSDQQVVEDQQGNASALRLGTKRSTIVGKDVAGADYPLWVEGETTPTEYDNGTTQGRILRLADSGTSNAFYNFGIDKAGNLYISSNTSEPNPLLTVSPDGEITLDVSNVKLKGLEALSGPDVVDMVYNKTTGQIGHQ